MVMVDVRMCRLVGGGGDGSEKFVGAGGAAEAIRGFSYGRICVAERIERIEGIMVLGEQFVEIRD